MARGQLGIEFAALDLAEPVVDSFPVGLEQYLQRHARFADPLANRRVGDAEFALQLLQVSARE